MARANLAGYVILVCTCAFVLEATALLDAKQATTGRSGPVKARRVALSGWLHKKRPAGAWPASLNPLCLLRPQSAFGDWSQDNLDAAVCAATSFRRIVSDWLGFTKAIRLEPNWCDTLVDQVGFH